MDIDYSPTGKEFVTGSYDRTIRMFRVEEGKSRDVYHGKRMQKFFINLKSFCHLMVNG
jgi:WD repeat and SOF domain-containing protein 1